CRFGRSLAEPADGGGGQSGPAKAAQAEGSGWRGIESGQRRSHEPFRARGGQRRAGGGHRRTGEFHSADHGVRLLSTLSGAFFAGSCGQSPRKGTLDEYITVAPASEEPLQPCSEGYWGCCGGRKPFFSKNQA